MTILDKIKCFLGLHDYETDRYNSDFTHRQAIINEETEGDLERITAPPDWGK